MSQKIKDRDLGNFRKLLTKDKEKFKQQFADVKNQYPLVALAFEIQKTTIKELVLQRSITKLEISSVYEAIFEDELIDSRIKVEGDKRWRGLITCLKRSTDYESGLSCFEEFNKKPYP